MLKIVACGYCRVKLRADDSKSFRCVKCGKVNEYIDYKEGGIINPPKLILGYLGRNHINRKCVVR